MSAHTPGPWKANGLPNANDANVRQNRAVWSDDGMRPICTVDFSIGKYAECPAHERHANAALIAAAPDLLAALQELLACKELAADAANASIACRPGAYVLHATYLQRQRLAWDIARAAIAKAEGRT